jgi:hypothetical protein
MTYRRPRGCDHLEGAVAGIVRERDACRFVEVGDLTRFVPSLNGSDHAVASSTRRVDVDHGDRVGHVVRDPHLETVRPNGHTDRVNPRCDAIDDLTRLGLHDEEGVVPVWPQAAERDPECAVSPGQLGAFGLAVHNGQLLSQGEVFERELATRAYSK